MNTIFSPDEYKNEIENGFLFRDTIIKHIYPIIPTIYFQSNHT